MASKTNTKIGDHEYYRITRKVGMKQNKRGVWVADYRQFYGRSKKEAEQKYKAFIGGGGLDSETCFGEFMDYFIEHVFVLDDSIKETTKTRYINAYRLVFNAGQNILGKQIGEISGADLQKVLSESNVAPSSIKQTRNLLRHFYRYLQNQHIAADVSQGLIVPAIDSKRKTQDIETYSEQELQRFIDATPKTHRLRLLVILGIFTGCRIGELLALTYEDLENDQVSISKGLVEIDQLKGSNNNTRVEVLETKTPYAVRAIPITNSIVKQAIAEHKKWHKREMLKNGYRTNYVFTSSTGQLYFISSVRMQFRRLCKKIGVEPKGFHTFRRTFGSRLASNNVPIQTLCKLMGHSSITVTAKYYINVPQDEKIAAVSAFSL